MELCKGTKISSHNLLESVPEKALALGMISWSLHSTKGHRSVKYCLYK